MFTQSNLQIQWDLPQNSNGIVYENRKNNPKTCGTQKTSKSQSNLGKEEQTWRHHTSWISNYISNLE